MKTEFIVRGFCVRSCHNSSSKTDGWNKYTTSFLPISRLMAQVVVPWAPVSNDSELIIYK